MGIMYRKIINTLKYGGVVLLLAGCIFLALVITPFQRLAPPLANVGILAIENVSVVDVENGKILPDKAMLIQNGLITKISDTLSLEDKTPGTKIIDGRGQYIMPGLWDMHVHLTKQSPHIAYPEFIRNGITHVRDMRGSINDTDPFAGVQSRLKQWNDEVEKNNMLGPLLHGFTSFAIEGSHIMYKGQPHFFNCSTRADAIKLVRFFAEKEVSLIKVYNNISREAFFALMKEAKKYGIDVAGHKPVRVSTVEAADAGMKSLEHARFLIWDGFPGASSLRSSGNPVQLTNTSLIAEMLKEHDTVLLQESLDALVRNNTWYCPTHITRRADAYADNEIFRAKYKSINLIYRFLALEDLDATVQEDDSPSGRKAYLDFYLKGLEISGKAYKNGVKILAGSDVPELPGISLHEELVELSKAGLPNSEILRTATLYPSKYYKVDKLYGTVSQGKKADLIVLRGNPLLNIENSNKISAVITNGRYLDKHFINSLEQKIQGRQKSYSLTAKLVWDMILYLIM